MTLMIADVYAVRSDGKAEDFKAYTAFAIVEYDTFYCKLRIVARLAYESLM